MNIKSFIQKVIEYRPHKRYILLAITIIYIIFKIYVIHTPNTEDDNLPDIARDAILTVVHNDVEHEDTQEWDLPSANRKL